MDVSTNILEEAINAPHGELKTLAERHGIAYPTFRKEVSIYERRQADQEQQEWMNAPMGRYLDTPVASAPSTQARDTLKTISSCPAPLELVKPPEALRLSRFLYCADIHAPIHDPVWVERLCRVAYHLGVQDVVIGGDAFDFAELSSHGADIEQPDLNESIEITGQVLRYIKSKFDKVHILPGNHCRRLAKKLDKHLSFRNLVKMAVGDMEGFVTTDNDYFLIDSPQGGIGWAAGHPRFFAQFPAKGLETIATQRQRHVLGAHSHTLGLIRHGKFMCISPGHMMRPDLTPYLVRSDGMSKHPDQGQAQGFVLIENTKTDGQLVTLFGEGLTRWSDYV